MSTEQKEVCTVCHAEPATHEISVTCHKIISSKLPDYSYVKPSFSVHYVVCKECVGTIVDVKLDTRLTRRPVKGSS